MPWPLQHLPKTPGCSVGLSVGWMLCLCRGAVSAHLPHPIRVLLSPKDPPWTTQQEHQSAETFIEVCSSTSLSSKMAPFSTAPPPHTHTARSAGGVTESTQGQGPPWQCWCQAVPKSLRRCSPKRQSANSTQPKEGAGGTPPPKQQMLWGRPGCLMSCQPRRLCCCQRTGHGHGHRQVQAPSIFFP